MAHYAGVAIAAIVINQNARQQQSVEIENN
jgi:hypothetical protein